MKRRVLHEGYFRFVAGDIGRGEREFLETTNSACIMVYVTDLDRFVMVRQPREAMVRDDNPDGLITEMIGGRFDRDIAPLELMVAEAREEAGVQLLHTQIESVNHGIPVALSAGDLNERSYLFYAEVDSSQVGPDQETFTADGEDERIQRLFVDPNDLMAYGCDDARVLAMLYHHLLRQAKKKEVTA